MALFLASCGAQDGRVPVFPVEGKVLHQGKSAEGALVAFHPINSPELAATLPSGKVQPDGTFRLTTYESGDGAPSGEYAVTVFWPEPPQSPIDAPDSGPDRLRGRYIDPQKSQWRVQIADEPKILEPFELK